MFLKWKPLLAALVGLCFSNLAFAQFWDQGFEQDLTRTSYNNVLDGLDVRPITYVECIWEHIEDDDLLVNRCFADDPAAETSWGNVSNGYWIGEFDQPNFWVLDMNNEARSPTPGGGYQPHLECNQGPGHLSLPRAEPGSGIMGFAILKDEPEGEDFFRISLVMNLLLDDYPNPCNDEEGAPDSIPFMSFGAYDTVGNGGPPGMLNEPGGYSQTAFTAKLWRFIPSVCPGCGGQGVAAFRIFAVAEWEGVQRLLFVNLMHHGVADGLIGKVWNWPIAQHYFQPGADVVYMDAEDIGPVCEIDDIPLLDEEDEEIEREQTGGRNRKFGADKE